MSDINHVWATRCLLVSESKVNNQDAEKMWVEHRLAQLTEKVLERCPIDKIRCYLLDSFCHPQYVENALMEIKIKRWEKAIATGKMPRY